MLLLKEVTLFFPPSLSQLQDNHHAATTNYLLQ